MVGGAPGVSKWMALSVEATLSSSRERVDLGCGVGSQAGVVAASDKSLGLAVSSTSIACASSSATTC